MDKKRFEKIISDIRAIKIQGARNIAKSALEAYYLFPSKSSKKKLLSLRPTEPMMENVLNMAEKGVSKKEILNHFLETQEKINQSVFKLIKNNEIIFTHCHSTNVVNSLIYAKKHGKTFQVYNTETRPLFQGRKTALELKKAGIKVTMFVDSALGVALSKEQGTKKPNKVFLGADALLKNGVINKIGSGMIAEIAHNHKIPLYIVADSWKFTKKPVPIEQRKLNEVWDKAPKNIKIKNPAFEFVPKKYLSGIVTEYGSMRYNQFLKKIK
jgi:translation initiation factor 2B subunit (eIF-2B alpha/beta/delta family)